LIFWVAAVFLLPVSPIWPPRQPFLPYGRPNLALAGLLVIFTVYCIWVHCHVCLGALCCVVCCLLTNKDSHNPVNLTFDRLNLGSRHAEVLP